MPSNAFQRPRPHAAGKHRPGKHRPRKHRPSKYSRTDWGIRTLAARLAAAAVILLLAAGGSIAAAPTAQADGVGSGVLSLAKSVDVTVPQEPGDTFVYSIGFGCSSTTTGCLDAVLTDAIPEPLEIAGPPIVVGAGSYDTQVTGNVVTVAFADPVANTIPARTGLTDGTIGSLQVPVRVPTGIAKSWDGAEVVNEAELTAANAVPKRATAVVSLAVPSVVSAAVTKTWAPVNAAYEPGVTSNISLTARNTSNIPATTLTLHEPANVGAPDNLFDFYNFSSFGGVTFPQGADRVRVDARVSGSWITGASAASPSLPSGVSAAAVEGLRLVFSSSTGDTIAARGTAGEVGVVLTQRATNRSDASPLNAGGIRENVANASVTTPEGDADSPEATAQQVIGPLTADVTVTKSFTVAEIPAGESTTALITATNASTGPLDSLLIAEPITPGSFFSADVRFAGINPTGSTWPSGATAAEVVWFMNSGPALSSQTVGSYAELSVPPLPVGGHITGFTIEFTGAIQVGAVAALAVMVDTTVAAAIASPAATLYPNDTSATGTNEADTDTDTAIAELRVWAPTIEVELTKSIRPEAVYAGGHSVVQLTATTAAATSTVRPHTITVTESLNVAGSAYWDAFRPVAIGPTAVPLGSELTIEYHDGSTWEPVTTVSGATEAQVFSATLADLLPSVDLATGVHGLRFVFEDTAGFGYATTVQPVIVFEARSQLRGSTDPTATGTFGDPATWASYENCALTEAAGSIGGAPLVATDDDCATARIIPTTGGPGLAISGKSWVNPTVPAQSGENRATIVRWGVQAAGFDEVLVTDTPNPSVAGVADTVFQAFNLRRIQPIDSTTDPLMRWDAVSKVERYSQTTDSWVDITAAACASGCVGEFGGYMLTQSQQKDTIGVRLTFIESPERAAEIAASGDPNAPAVGSGVAHAPAGTYAGADAEGRTLRLGFTLRNTERMPADPTNAWVTGEKLYNEPDPGVVRNDVSVTADTLTRTSSDTIVIQQTPPTVVASKTVSPGTLTIPQPDVPQADYPTARYTATVQNPSPTHVSHLRLSDPSMCADPTDAATCGFGVGDVPFAGAAYNATRNPFERLNLTGITITQPASTGIQAAEVHLWHYDPVAPTVSGPYTRAQAQALTAAALADVIGVTVLFCGMNDSGSDSDGATIRPGATATVALDTQLRRVTRSTGAMVTPSTVPNTVLVGVHDQVLFPHLYSQDSASAPLVLAEGYVEVAATKAIAPGSTLLASPQSPVVVELRGRSTGTVQPKQLTVEDETATFWNAFTLRSLSVPAMPAGADRVELLAKVGSTWLSSGPTTQALAALPAGVDPAQVTGVRAVFTRANGAAFDGANDAVNVQLLTELRGQLRDGSGAVTGDRSPTPMPGETLPGLVSNTVLATVAYNELTASDTDSELFRILTGTAELAVTKTSVGETVGGKEIPFTLRVKNNGTGTLLNPVVVDQLPGDGSLRYIPTDMPHYATSPGGTLSTNPAHVAHTFDADTGQLRFTWPAGATMAPGETYSITFRLQVKPGLPAGTVALNTMQVSNDRPLDDCTALSPGSGRAASWSGDICATDNIVTVQELGSFSAIKGVKSDLGTATNTLNPGAQCHPDGEGFFRYPCAADTMIGATDVWKLQLINGGTISGSTLEVIDIFPRPGDVGVVDLSPRGSSYIPAFNAGVQLASTVPGVTFEWYYTTTPFVCTDDLYPTQPECAAGSWFPGSSLVLGQAAMVTAMKLVFDFSGVAGGVLPPAAELTVTYETVNVPSRTAGDFRAPVTVPVDDVRAWASFGYYPTYVSGPNPPSPEEPIKAGVVLASGSLQAGKVVTGTDVGRAPTEFTAEVTCTIAGTAVVMGPLGRVTLDEANDYTARIDGIPVGAECMVAEDGPAGWFGESSRNGPQTVTVAAGARAEAVPAGQHATLVNTYLSTLIPVTGPQAVTATLTAALGALLLGAALLLRRRFTR